MIRSFRNFLALAFIGSVALPPVAFLGSSALHLSASETHKIALYTLLGLVALPGFYFLLIKLEPYLLEESRDQAAYLETITGSVLSVAIAGSAALSLFLELAVIRWQGSIFVFFSFYKNYGLLACFAGLGLGYALSRHDSGIPLNLTPPLLAWQFGLLIFLRFGLPQSSDNFATVPFREQLSMGLLTATSAQNRAVYLLLAVTFLLTALAFIPIGQLCGKLMENTGRLSAYGLNLFGSLVGVSLMFLVSLLWMPPVVWFGLCFLALCLFLRPRPGTLFIGITFATMAIVTLAWPVNPLWNRVYSPYQLLEIGYSDTGQMLIRAGGHYYQRVQDLSTATVGPTSNPTLQLIRDYYDLPYRFHPGPNEVAVVGAGAGNDVAAALRSGARHVDAIEIDPAILLAGKMNHPEKPYDDPRVRPIVNDARSFIRSTNVRYDMIVYGLLDSHTLLSAASSVRLDSFVYTVEGLREAREKLKENGVLSLSFSVINADLGVKIYRMMREAFDGKEPICVNAVYDGSFIFIQSKHGDLSIPRALIGETRFTDGSPYFRNAAVKVDLSTDDWPFFYMPRRVYPVSYLTALGLILLISFVLNASFLQQRPQTSHLAFFFLGAGFMLVETKAITEMGLAFGNTWQVIAIAIASILVMAFLANGVVRYLRLSNPYVAYLLLIVSVVVGWWIARTGGLPSNVAGRIGTAFALTCPLFFSGIVFSTLLSVERRISSAMSMNLMGAMVGGVLEYNSMYFGFHFLYLLALGLYAAALVSTLAVRSGRSPVSIPSAALVSSTK
jgi:spermine/spermidine synthase